MKIMTKNQTMKIILKKIKMKINWNKIKISNKRKSTTQMRITLNLTQNKNL